MLEECSINRTDSAYCYKHRRCCPLSPPAGWLADAGCVWWLDVSGVICTPWSSQGLQLRWLDEKALSTLVHYLQLCTSEVDLAIVECTPRLDTHSSRQMLEPVFNVEEVVLDPQDIGLPCSRRRLYMRFSGAVQPSKRQRAKDTTVTTGP